MRHQSNFHRSRFNHKLSPGRGFPKKADGVIIAAIRASSMYKPVAEGNDITEIATLHFNDFEISSQLKENIAAKGYLQPTPIQEKSIPVILAGRDLIGIANTGTGKTAAFLIPLIEKIYRNRKERVLVITPTRELALQIGDVLRDFNRGIGVRWAMVIGGVDSWKQRRDIQGGAQIVIGTPGRLKDLVQSRILDLSQFKNVVLDEADRMVDIGFIHDVKFFVSQLPKFRQSLFFSATISGKVKEILNQFVDNPVTVSVKKQETVKSVSQNLIQVTSGKKKIDYLHELLIQQGFNKVLIFGRTKWGIDKLSRELTARGFKTGAIHGNKRQSQRQRILDMFRNNQINILLATDIASRGLDIDNVSHVINYDLPQSYEDYIHRIGRTGRADKTGTALTFVE